MKISVSATEFLSPQQVAQILSDLIFFFATCYYDKILLQKQRFPQKFSSTHEVICRCAVFPRHVSATCRLKYTDL